MKNQTLKASIIGLTLLCSSATLAQQQAVNIVFTSPENNHTIDTIIDQGQKALEDLMQHHQLDHNSILLVDLAESMAEKHSETHHQVFILKEDENDADNVMKTKVVKINANDQSAETRVEVIHEDAKAVEIEIEEIISDELAHVDQLLEDLNMEDNLQIQVEIDNGEKSFKATKNGKELSEKELQKLMEEHQILLDVAEDSAMVMIESLGDDIEYETKFIKKIEVNHMEPTPENVAAVVITKPIDVANSAHTDTRFISLTAFPNPVKDMVSISFEGIAGQYELSISALSGQELYHKTDNAEGTITQEIDLSNYASGSYIVHLNHKGGSKSLKLIKE